MADQGPDEHDQEFQSADSGAAKTYPIQCSALRKNGFVCIKGKPCKIVEMSTSKTGKHGHAKVHMVALEIFTQKKMEDICPSTHKMEVPNVSRIEYQCLDVLDEDYVSLMDDAGDVREDLKLPEDSGLRNDIIAKNADQQKDGPSFFVTVLAAMGQEQIISCKNATGNEK